MNSKYMNLEVAVGWLVATPDLRWDGARLVSGYCSRNNWGRFACLGTGVPALTQPHRSRIFRTTFYGVTTVPGEIRDHGIGRALGLWFSEADECTKFEDGKYVITDPELLSWTFPDKTTIAEWQK